jgi:hypothetical protein
LSSLLAFKSNTNFRNQLFYIMTLKQQIELMRSKMFDLISTKHITFLNEMDYKINLHEFNYHYFYFDYGYIWGFLKGLEDKKIYIVLPILSKYTKVNDPHVILSQQFLVTKHCNPMLICDFIESKINKT